MFTFNNANYCEFCFERIVGPSYVCPCCGSSYDPRRSPGSLPVGHVLAGNYLVGRVIGQGGFGKTYLCFDIKNCTRVAIKEYFPEAFAFRNNGDSMVYPKQNSNTFKKGARKFYKEAHLLVHFRNNPEIVRVDKLFEQNNTVYFVMEYLVGCDLKNYFRNNPPMSENLVICIALEVLKGLRVLHSRGVLHRDIAPDNIYMCSDGRVKLIDFGASRFNVGAISNSLSLVLKPGFAPFEQYQTKGNQGPWTDIYALGATMYYLIKRKLPPESVARVSNNYLDLSGISPYLGKVLAKMMALRPAERYRSVDQVMPDLIMAQRMNTGLYTHPQRISNSVQQNYAPQNYAPQNNVVPQRGNNTPSAPVNMAPSNASNPSYYQSAPEQNPGIPSDNKKSRSKVLILCLSIGIGYLLLVLLVLLLLL